jgi:hypothetical protein
VIPAERYLHQEVMLRLGSLRPDCVASEQSTLFFHERNRVLAAFSPVAVGTEQLKVLRQVRASAGDGHDVIDINGRLFQRPPTDRAAFSLLDKNPINIIRREAASVGGFADTPSVFDVFTHGFPVICSPVIAASRYDLRFFSEAAKVLAISLLDFWPSHISARLFALLGRFASNAAFSQSLGFALGILIKKCGSLSLSGLFPIIPLLRTQAFFAACRKRISTTRSYDVKFKYWFPHAAFRAEFSAGVRIVGGHAAIIQSVPP